MAAIDRPIRVLELRSVRGTGGGPEKTILLGTARTDPAKYAITVCYLRDQRDEVFHIDQRAGALPIDYVEIRERHSFDRSIWAPLRALVRDRRIDIVHAHDYKTDLLAWLLGMAEAVIPMSTAHGWAGHSWREQRCYYPADRLIQARMPRIIAVSSDIRQSLVSVGASPFRIDVVPNGIDERRFRRDPQREPEARRAFGVRGRDYVIGAVGRLEPEKNYALLLTAFQRVSKGHPDVRLLIAGDGSLRAALQAQVDGLGLQGRCSILGHVSDVPFLHHALDAFIMCSDNEGSPNAVLEAMALGTPVVCTDVGGVGDLVRDNLDGLLVGRRDLEGLVRAIEDTVTHQERARRRAQSARSRVESEFSFSGRMCRVEGICDDLMEKYAQGPRGKAVVEVCGCVKWPSVPRVESRSSWSFRAWRPSTSRPCFWVPTTRWKERPSPWLVYLAFGEST